MTELVSMGDKSQPLHVVNSSVTCTALFAGLPLARVDEDLVINLSSSQVELR